MRILGKRDNRRTADYFRRLGVCLHAAGLEPLDQSFWNWLWHVCIKRFSSNYNSRLISGILKTIYLESHQTSVHTVRVFWCSWPNQTSPQSNYNGTQFQCTFIWGRQHTIPLLQDQVCFRQLSSLSSCVRLRDEPHLRCPCFHTNYTSQPGCSYTMIRRSLVRLPLKLRTSRGYSNFTGSNICTDKL